MRKRPSLDRAVERRTGIAAHPHAPRLQTKNHADPSESDDPAGVVVPSDQREARAPLSFQLGSLLPHMPFDTEIRALLRFSRDARRVVVKVSTSC
jgi:hypothetical protein